MTYPTRILRPYDEGCPSPSDLSELLSYNPDTGHLHWKERDEKWFSDKGRSASFSQAVSCRKNAEIALGYHENHGVPR